MDLLEHRVREAAEDNLDLRLRLLATRGVVFEAVVTVAMRRLAALLATGGDVDAVGFLRRRTGVYRQVRRGGGATPWLAVEPYLERLAATVREGAPPVAPPLPRELAEALDWADRLASKKAPVADAAFAVDFLQAPVGLPRPPQPPTLGELADAAGDSDDAAALAAQEAVAAAAALLAGVPLLQRGAAATGHAEFLAALARAARRAELPGGAVLCRAGGAVHALAVVERGDVVAIVDGEATGVLRAGDAFGEAGLVDAARHAATLVTHGSCELLLLAPCDFLATVARFPEQCAAIAGDAGPPPAPAHAEPVLFNAALSFANAACPSDPFDDADSLAALRDQLRGCANEIRRATASGEAQCAFVYAATWWNCDRRFLALLPRAYAESATPVPDPDDPPAIDGPLSRGVGAALPEAVRQQAARGLAWEQLGLPDALTGQFTDASGRADVARLVSFNSTGRFPLPLLVCGCAASELLKMYPADPPPPDVPTSPPVALVADPNSPRLMLQRLPKSEGNPVADDELRAAFAALDRDGSGRLDAAEFKRAYVALEWFGKPPSEAEVDAAFRRCCRDAAKGVTFDEFAVLMLQRSRI